MPSIREGREHIERLLEIAEAGGEAEAVGQELLELRDVVENSAALYQELDYERRGVRRARVEAAVALSSEQQARLQSALAKLFAAPVVIEQQVTPDIIAGVRVTVGDSVIDNTVQGRLRRMLASIHQAPVPEDLGGSLDGEAG